MATEHDPAYRCRMSGLTMHPPIVYWTKDAAMYSFTCWYCPDCGRKVPTTLAGQRGHWYRVYSDHPRRGVTKQQWNATRHSGAMRESEAE